MRRRAIVLVVVGALLIALSIICLEPKDNRPVRHSSGGLAVWEI